MAQSSPAQPVDPSDPGINLVTLGLTWTLTSLAILAVAARFHVRRKLGNRWASHDWIMLAAMSVQIFYQSGLTVMCKWGSGKALQNLYPEQLIMIRKWSWIIAPAVYVISILARISIALLLVQIFGVKRWFKNYLIYYTGFQTVVGVTVFIFTVAQSQPYEVYWNPTLPGGRHWDRRIYNYTAVIYILLCAVSDLTFVVFPIMIISRLNMNLGRKIGLSILLGFSLITFGAALAKGTIALLQITGATNLLGSGWKYLEGIINLVTCVEQDLVIIMGCVPVLHSLTKLKMTLPTVHDISASLVSLLHATRRKGSSSGSSRSARNEDYYHIELTPQYNYTDDEGRTKPPVRGPVIQSVAQEHNGSNLPNDNSIERRDSFSVSYDRHEKLNRVCD
ncbi:hypothetical protein GGS20DRAFT_338671 [Poronia punctata]|nr:hypothetical protein GGS20DRAFT_338671 [Poronia punctata]